ncbi:MAG: hypothetical protein GX913_07065 [Clostridiales bacterium]|nr:hypothetical protein [Clostridiales bacterium]
MKYRLPLEGNWNFGLDPDKVGLKEKWYHYNLKDYIQIPGILQAQGYGDKINHNTPWISGLHDPLWYKREEYQGAQEDKVRVPFLSQPKAHYQGQAWYQKEFEITSNMAGSTFEFTMECSRWKTMVWINDEYIGEVTSLCGPHRYDLGVLKKGDYKITVCIDNSFLLPYRPDGHGVSDALGATWNGIVGEVKLIGYPLIHLGDVRVYPDIDTRKVDVQIEIKNESNTEQKVKIDVAGNQTEIKATPGNSQAKIQVSYPMDTPLWDEFSPATLSLMVSLKSDEYEDEKEISFGFRKAHTKDGMFYINHRPTYFRGTHFGGDFPLTGYPSTKVEEWKKMFETCMSYGLNFVRFHSYCPPKAAFLAADELGFYLQVECGMWNVFNENSEMNIVLEKETDLILKEFGNHPSFVMLSPSNEPGGAWEKPLTQWVADCKEKDSRHLYTIQSGWPFSCPPSEITGTDYVYFHRSGYGIQPGGTIRNSQGWFGGDYRKSLEGIKYPVISHEMGQWCSYPNFDIIDKFTGNMEASNYMVFKDSAKKNGVLEQNKDFVYASGRLQVEMYKEDLEANFRTPHIYGFELLDLRDYLGQGTALVGVVDAFWDNKGYVSPEEFRRFCSESVALLRIEKRVFLNNERFSYPVELAHFGKEAIKNATIYWRIKSGEEVFAEGDWYLEEIPLGKNIPVGNLELSLQNLQAPACYQIEIGISEKSIFNSWEIFVYEAEQKEPKLTTAFYTRSFSEAKEALEKGEKVIFMPYLSTLNWKCPPLSGKPVFWNAQMGPKWSRGMGLLCQEKHPALSKFPTENYQSWQWNDILSKAKGINLEGMPEELLPIVQPIDEWNRNYKMGLIVECNVSKGSLLLISADLETDIEKRPVAKQLKSSIFEYVESDKFSPEAHITLEQLTKCFTNTLIMKQLKVKADLVEYPEIDLTSMIDGDPNTNFVSSNLEYPYTIDFKWDKVISVKGLTYMPRQNQRNHEGEIREYSVEAFENGSWNLVTSGEFASSFDPKDIYFSKAINTSSLRFIAKNGFNKENFPIWKENREGWCRHYEDFVDSTLAVAEIALISDDEPMLHLSHNDIQYKSSTTATIEIEE